MFTLICQHLYGEQIGEYAVSQSIKEWNQNAFLWGVQGYEFLTFHRLLFWQSGIMLKSYTERFDSLELSTILKAIDDYRQKKDTPVLRCYRFGLECRAVLKAETEPFIQYGLHMLKQAYPKEQELSLRNKIETSLDIILLRYLKGQLPIEFDMKQIFPKDEAVQLEVASLYCYLLNILFDEKQELSVLLQATEDARKTCGMLNDRSTLKKSFFERMERGKEYKRRLSSYFRGINEGDAYDYANTYHAQWQWPIEDTADRTESYMDLFELAVEQSKHLLMNQKKEL